MKRSYCCNVQLMKELRLRKGLTQSELANISGYCERLINKAESGAPISAATVEVLAEALSSEDRKISLHELVFDPRALAHEFITCFHKHQRNIVKNIHYFLDERVVFRIAGETNMIPFAGEHHGIAAAQQLFHMVFTMLEVPSGSSNQSNCRFYVADNEVVIWGESWLQPIGHPLLSPVEITHRLVFKQGKLIEVSIRLAPKLAEALRLAAIESA